VEEGEVNREPLNRFVQTMLSNYLQLSIETLDLGKSLPSLKNLYLNSMESRKDGFVSVSTLSFLSYFAFFFRI